jgi:hypothetical protein
MKNERFTNLVVKGVLTSSLIISMGAGTVLAEEVGTNPAAETSTVMEGTPTTEVNNATDATTEEVVKVEAPQKDVNIEEESEAPSLIPGDFFYFVKLMLEKIRLAVTVDDYKEAGLLAEFAGERIAEAKKLIVEGEKEEAEKSLQEAITTQELASQTLPVVEVTAVEGTESAVTTEDQNIEGEQEVQSKLANNVDSLLLVLEKIENPKAQKAIMKNIEKSFKKLDKKFAKLEEAEAKFAEKMTEVEGELAAGQITVEEATTEKTKLTEELSTKTEKIEQEEVKAVEKINKEVTKTIEKQAKKDQQAVKKAEHEEAKKAEKKEREELKAAEKKKREELKAAREKQREEAKKAKEKKHKDKDDDKDHDDDNHHDEDHDHDDDHDRDED